LRFGQDALQQYYIDNNVPLPQSLSYEQHMADIERVEPEGKRFLEDV